MDLTIRPAEPRDLPALGAFLRALAEHHGETASLSEAQLQRLFFGARRAASALIAEAGGRPVGYAAAVPMVRLVQGETGVEVQHLFVEPAHRGRGIGRALVEAAGRAAAQNGGAYLVIGTKADNRAAQTAYRRMGLEDVPDGGPRFFRRLVA
jgi:ribosomal protein S18 acetylase RimI-like enzyme